MGNKKIEVSNRLFVEITSPKTIRIRSTSFPEECTIIMVEEISRLIEALALAKTIMLLEEFSIVDTIKLDDWNEY